jgi:serine protease
MHDAVSRRPDVVVRELLVGRERGRGRAEEEEHDPEDLAHGGANLHQPRSRSPPLRPILAGLRRAALTLLFLLLFAAPAQALIPNDPGILGRPGGWQLDQWNFLPQFGVDAPRAWDNLIAAGRPGGLGVKVAVLDTGLAYENRGGLKRSPDISRYRIADPMNFCAHIGRGENSCYGRNRHPDDHNGHGTHVASTIAEATGNGIGETGLAYGATIMPVQVLNRLGFGDDQSISDGIRYAADHGARVINLSFEFGKAVTSAAEVPGIARAVRYARRKGATIVAAAGNTAAAHVDYPAALPGVISVGAVTDDDCLAKYSNTGDGLDLVAPGGGDDAGLDQPNCDTHHHGKRVVQMTFTRYDTTFRMPTNYYGTSMAAPHVSATAALIIASGVLGRHPTPAAVERRLETTARDLGQPGRDAIYGAGLVDAGAATAPG